MNMPHIANYIRDLRRAKRMTQNEFAKRVGVTKSAVSAYENGARLPSYDILLKIARTFNVTVDAILLEQPINYLNVSGLTESQRNSIQGIIAEFLKANGYYSPQ